MPGYCFDTDALSGVIRPKPSLPLVRRLASVPIARQFTTAITMGELLFGAKRRDSATLLAAVEELLASGPTVLPFDATAAERYADLRVALESEGRRLDEPDLRIAAIALSRDLTLITGNTRHFDRVPGLRIENWLQPQ